MTKKKEIKIKRKKRVIKKGRNAQKTSSTLKPYFFMRTDSDVQSNYNFFRVIAVAISRVVPHPGNRFHTFLRFQNVRLVSLC